MALQSDWAAGSAIVAFYRGEPTVLGEVLCAEARHRLSHVIRPPAASAVYLTWLLRHQVEGCICKLQIDEADTPEMVELEDVWLPIPAGLQRCVDALPDQRWRSDKPEPSSDLGWPPAWAAGVGRRRGPPRTAGVSKRGAEMFAARRRPTPLGDIEGHRPIVGKHIGSCIVRLRWIPGGTPDRVVCRRSNKRFTR
jgi:hypothetical protein